MRTSNSTSIVFVSLACLAGALREHVDTAAWLSGKANRSSASNHRALLNHRDGRGPTGGLPDLEQVTEFGKLVLDAEKHVYEIVKDGIATSEIDAPTKAVNVAPEKFDFQSRQNWKRASLHVMYERSVESSMSATARNPFGALMIGPFSHAVPCGYGMATKLDFDIAWQYIEGGDLPSVMKEIYITPPALLGTWGTHDSTTVKFGEAAYINDRGGAALSVTVNTKSSSKGWHGIHGQASGSFDFTIYADGSWDCNVRYPVKNIEKKNCDRKIWMLPEPEKCNAHLGGSTVET